MRFLLLLLLGSQVFGISLSRFFPIRADLELISGYDSNVLRLSSREMNDSALDPTLLGKQNTFDSAYLRFGIRGSSYYRLASRNNYFRTAIDLNQTAYLNSPDRCYWSGSVSLVYQWQKHFRIEGFASRLDKFYLRDYLDRDLSEDILVGCYFTDQETGVKGTFPFTDEFWVQGEIGFLQRYYNSTFSEFDLDIWSATIKSYLIPLNRHQVSLEFTYGQAKNITFGQSARSSDFDRSYSYLEWYIPVRRTFKRAWLSEIGAGYRQEDRFYQAESWDDPLHSGRNHRDRKVDFWLNRDLGKSMEISAQVRYRVRDTNSNFEWVHDLKSFNQLQVWMTLSRSIDYDRY